MKKNSESDNIEIKLIDEISNSAIENIAIDISEVALDSILEEGVLRDLPGLNIVNGLIRTTKNIREKIFAKKILLFLQSLNDCELSKRQSFVKQIDSNPKEKQRIGETLIAILERIDNFEKPKIIGNLFKAYLMEMINYEEFVKMSSIVNRIDLNDIKLLKNTNDIKRVPTEILESLAINGLMSFGIMDQPLTADMTKISPHLFYVPNTVGRKLLKFGF